MILDDKGILKLGRILPSEMTAVEQVVFALGETAEWSGRWAAQILSVITTYDRELGITQEVNEARRKQAKLDETRLAFEAETARNEERIRQQVLQRFHANRLQQSDPNNATPTLVQPPTSSQNILTVNTALQNTAGIPDNIGPRRSTRQVRKLQK